MKMADFNAMHLDKRCDAVFEWGFYLSKVVEGEFNKILYAYNGYFVELVMRISDNAIVEANAFGKDELAEHRFSISTDNPFHKIMAAG